MDKKPDYIIYTDGGSRGNPGEAAYGYVIYNTNREKITACGKTLGITTNNVAEYMGVVSSMEWVEKNAKIPNPTIHYFMDSLLVASQLSGLWKIKSEHLRNLYFTIKKLENLIKGQISYTAVRREFNTEADRMVNLALDGKV